MRVKEWRGSVVFLHEVAEGVAKRSWGVHVAELAGVPQTVVRRAAGLVTAMEKGGGTHGATRLFGELPLFAAYAAQPEVAIGDIQPLLRALDGISPDTMSPKEALDALYLLKTLAPPCARDLT
jgi:DNA mismatch repair protein MutS